MSTSLPILTVTTLLFLFSLNLASSLEVNGNTVSIHNASDFIELSDNVNTRGILYEGSTVVLAADIDFTGYSDKFIPIGVNGTTIFNGDFDGQGHTISNLVMDTPRNYVCVFSFVNSTTFKNVVLDSSCSIQSTHDFTIRSACVGGIICNVYPNKDSNPVVEGCVNMADVRFAGKRDTYDEDISYTIGGVVAFAMPDITTFRIRDCVNYGTITFSGKCHSTAIGGVFGAFFYGNLSSKYGCFIENCANYGRLVHNGETMNMLGIGSIIAVAVKGHIENCINYEVFKTNQDVLAGGKIMGGADKKLTINNCFWTNEQDTNVSYGFEYMTSPRVINSHFVDSNTTTMDILNAWARAKSEEGGHNYSKWMMLHLNGGRMGTVSEDALLIVPKKPFPDPVKEGHRIRWCTEPDCTSGEHNGTIGGVSDLYALWVINNYTVTFDYGNGTFIYSSFTFNSSIVYPAAPQGKGFHGWNVSIERMPGHDLVIGPNITALPPSSKSLVGAIAGGVIGGVALIAIVVIVVLVILLKKQSNSIGDKEKRSGLIEGSYVRLTNIYPRVVEKDVQTNFLTYEPQKLVDYKDIYTGLYPENYRVDSIRDALGEAGYDIDRTSEIMGRCEYAAESARGEGNLPDGFTINDAAAVALYTYDSGDSTPERSPYRLINKALTGETNEELRKVRGMLFVMLSALRKLPRFEMATLYRGVRNAVDMSECKTGRVVVFHGLASASTNMNTVKDFLMSTDDSDGVKRSCGTFFVIEEAWGYDIQPFSLFPNEKEVILEPERQFLVRSVIESDVVIVNMKMLDTPLILPEVFGCDDETCE